LPMVQRASLPGADKKVPGRGIITSISLWFALLVASLPVTGWTSLPGDVVRIEAAYTFLASVITGAIIGGLSGKLVEQAFEQK
jgi:hypothetical protein